MAIGGVLIKRYYFFFFFVGSVNTLFVTSCMPITRRTSRMFTVSLERGIVVVDEIEDVFIFVLFNNMLAKLIIKAKIRKLILCYLLNGN
ncbi:hypothetical protein Emtol_3463 [Emticicia oligotrophica DSM 17448]|jgi:hypothetical protein|uniref:Secreted protein n=1 Tax=Emticicia oligotrophica (strain DSM 17448 / CIP 109782 / MTCC 6937 / GPTSA100-15) TaxID=929562 RepID=A0ABN4AT07_EMTOG|nr:hypothetical protein Emtol_3463 [Emticicia oligotrophica DSM 17448]